jgi:hypothetical protein
MLSFLFRLMKAFQREHGFVPNVLYINEFHYQNLLENLPGLRGPEDITRFLQMEIIVSGDAIHPHVAWISPRRRSHAAHG